MAKGNTFDRNEYWKGNASAPRDIRDKAEIDAQDRGVFKSRDDSWLSGGRRLLPSRVQPDERHQRKKKLLENDYPLSKDYKLPYEGMPNPDARKLKRRLLRERNRGEV